MRSAIVFAFPAGLLAWASQSQAQPAKKGPAELQGSWQAVSGESLLSELKDPGFLFPHAKAKLPDVFHWVIAGDRLTITDAHKKMHTQRTVRADSTREPKTLDIQEGEKGRTVRAIYKLEKEKLRVVIGDGKEYPKDLKSESGQLILVFERQKAE